MSGSTRIARLPNSMRTMRNQGEVVAVVGGQYGSEGKGNIVKHMAQHYDIHVRTGGPNAGHSFYWKGKKRVMQSIPCGWINPEAILVIGRGALIDLKTLTRELYELEDECPDIWSRLRVDAKAGVIDPTLHNEGHTHGELHKLIGSTGEGVGAARMARMSRREGSIYTFEDAVDMPEWVHLSRLVQDDTPELLNRANKEGKHILLEGTQGSGLSLIHGPWPYVTSNDTNAAQMCADAGLAPQLLTRTLMVIRTMPIRVAGNSGPLARETNWEEVSRRVGQNVEERTTVTKKVRRIGEWDTELVNRAVTLNRPAAMAVTFADYLDPSIAGITNIDQLTIPVNRFIHMIESLYDIPVAFVGTGGPGWEVIDMEGFAHPSPVRRNNVGSF